MTGNGRAISYRKIPVDQIMVDKAYQRPLSVKRVDGMVDGFDEHLFQAPEVTPRPRGGYACFEGQHRVVAERKRGTKAIMCRVHEGLTQEEEGHYFAKFQLNRKALRPYDRWRAQLYAKEATQVEINKLVEGWGFRVTSSGSNVRGIAAVTALEQVYARGGGPHLDDVLGFVAELWDGEQSALNHAMLLGVSTFLTAFGERVGEKQRKHIAKHSPIVVLRRAVAHGLPTTASAEGVAFELRKMAVMTRTKPVRYTRVFGPPERPQKKRRPVARAGAKA